MSGLLTTWTIYGESRISLDDLMTRCSILSISWKRLTRVYLPIIAFLTKAFMASALDDVCIPALKIAG